MIAIVDYGAGNIQSVVNAIEYIGYSCTVAATDAEIQSARAAILPGVGAFGDAMQALKKTGLDSAIKQFILSGKPFLGICLGMQVLFENSEESTGVAGLGILKGSIKRIPSKKGLKIPHMGWNSLECLKKGDLYEGQAENPYVYFVHSYYLPADNMAVSAVTEYGVKIGASLQRDNLYAMQFHPEKSGKAGIKILENFCKKG